MDKKQFMSESNEVKIPVEITLKFKNEYDFTVLQNALLSEESLFPYDKLLVVGLTSLLKELYVKISIKLVALKSTYKLKLKAHDQMIVFIACTQAMETASIYDREVLRVIIHQVHLNFSNG